MEARAHAGLHTNGLVRILCVASRRSWSRSEAVNTIRAKIITDVSR